MAIADDLVRLQTQYEALRAFIDGSRDRAKWYALIGNCWVFGGKITAGFSAADMHLALDGAASGDTAHLNPDRATTPVYTEQYSNIGVVYGDVFLMTDKNVSVLDTSALTVGTAPGAGFHRYDLVYAFVANTGPGIAIAQGSAVANASTPTDPQLPHGAVALARVHVQSSVTAITNADITDIRSFTSRLGGGGGAGAQILYQTTAPTNDQGANGDACFRYDTWDVYRKNGGAWVLLGNIKGAQGNAGLGRPTFKGAPDFSPAIPFSDAGDCNDEIEAAWASRGYVELRPNNTTDAWTYSVFQNEYHAIRPILIPKFGGLSGANSQVGISGIATHWNTSTWRPIVGFDTSTASAQSGGFGYQQVNHGFASDLVIYGDATWNTGTPNKTIGFSLAAKAANGEYVNGVPRARVKRISAANFAVGIWAYSPQYNQMDDLKAGNCRIGILYSPSMSGGGLVDQPKISWAIAHDCHVGHLFIRGPSSLPSQQVGLEGAWSKYIGDPVTGKHGCTFAFINSPYHQANGGAGDTSDFMRFTLDKGTAEYNTAGQHGESDTVTAVFPEVVDGSTVVTSSKAIPTVEMFLDSYNRVHVKDYTFQTDVRGIVTLMENGAILEWGQMEVPAQCGYAVRARGKDAFVDFMGPLASGAGIVENVRCWPMGQSVNGTNNWGVTYSGFGPMVRFPSERDILNSLDLDATAFSNTLQPPWSASDAGVTAGTGAAPGSLGDTVSYIEFASGSPNAVARTPYLGGGATAKTYSDTQYAVTNLWLYNNQAFDVRLIAYIESNAGAWLAGCNPAHIATSVPEAITLWAQTWMRLTLVHSLSADGRLALRRLDHTTDTVRIYTTRVANVRPSRANRQVFNDALHNGGWVLRP